MIDPGFSERVMSSRNFQCTYPKLKKDLTYAKVDEL
jgi:hypothetical protein